MTCRHCCGADQFFDLPMAEKELSSYRKKGTTGVTKRILGFLSKYDVQGSSLLDIGGGIGAIQWYFLTNKASKTTDVDAAGGYLKVAQDFAIEKGWGSSSEFVHGDFVDVAGQIKSHDYVSLDKVICCYPDYQQLLSNAVTKTNKVMILSFPLGGFIAKIVAEIASVYFRFRKIPFRPYIHSSREVLAFVESMGLRRVERQVSFPWNVWVFER